MKVALIQTSLFWEDHLKNQAQLTQKINSIDHSVDLIVLPEMCNSGFTMNPDKVAQPINGETITWLITIAKLKKCALTGSLVIKENDKFYNRLVFILPTGKVLHYDKRHLFSLAGENKFYTSGDQKLIVTYKGFKICPLICYDLRFPVFSRNVEDYDVLIYVANWPKPRINAWDALLKARAIENMCYSIGVNRIGRDNNNLEYTGHSQAINFMGDYLLEPQQEEGVFIVTLDKNTLLESRKRYGFLEDRDKFLVL